MSLSKFFANFAAEYSAKWEKENADYIMSTQAAFFQQAQYNAFTSYYETFAEILKTAINNSSTVTHITPLGVSSQLFITPPTKIMEQGFICLNFKAYYNKHYGVPAQEVKNTIQKEINNLTVLANIPRIKLFWNMMELTLQKSEWHFIVIYQNGNRTMHNDIIVSAL